MLSPLAHCAYATLDNVAATRGIISWEDAATQMYQTYTDTTARCKSGSHKGWFGDLLAYYSFGREDASNDTQHTVDTDLVLPWWVAHPGSTKTLHHKTNQDCIVVMSWP